ncbi:MAG: hypothetical protein AB8F95_20240 [Bacteroidia bacterium]
MSPSRSLLLLLLCITFLIPFLSIAQSAIDHWETAVFNDDTWSYRVGTSAPPALFKDACSKVGLTITLEPTSFKMLGPKIMTHQFEMALLASSTYSHPYDFEQDFSRNHPGNHTGFGSAKLDSLIDAAGKALNPTTRRDLAWQIQAEVHREKPLMYLFASSQPVAIHDRLGNTKVMAYSPYVWLNGLKP